MKPAIRKSKANGAFATVLTEACKVVQEFRQMGTLAALKLTPAAFAASALRIANTDPQRLAALEAALDQPTFEACEAKASMRRMMVAFRSANFPGPPRELRRLNYLLTPAAVAELAVLGSSTFELAALAAKVATEKFPQDFGTCENIGEHEKRLLALGLKRDELYEQISEEVGTADIVTSAPDSEGRVTQTFACSHGLVSLHPKDNAGERLISWMLNQEQQN